MADASIPADSPGDPDETEHPRRKSGDDPFLPEEGYFWWLPRAMAIALVSVCVVLLTVASVHHGKFRLQRLDDGTVQLERGRFAPRGWGSFVPDGALGAWAPVPWPAQAPEPPLRGELRDLADTWLGMLRAQAEATNGDTVALAELRAREDSFSAWYSSHWGEEPPAEGSIGRLIQEQEQIVSEAAAAREEQRREETEAAARAAAVEEMAAAQRRIVDPEGVNADEIARARDYAADRRAVLRGAEELHERLPGGGTPEEQRDREAIEAFIEAMDTPAGLAVPVPTESTPAP